MLFVILGHFALPKYGLTLVYAFDVPLFFIVSGMTFRPGRYTSVRACAVDKAKKLLVPYVLLQFVMIPAWYLNWKVLASAPADFQGLIAGILVSNEALLTSPTNATWFLPCLFLLSVSFFAVSRWSGGSERRLAIAVALSGAIGALLSVYYRVSVPWHVPTMFTAAVFYYVGYEFMKHRERIVALLEAHPASWSAAVLALTGTGMIVALLNGKVSMHENHFRTLPMFYVAALALSFAVIFAVMRMPRVKALTYFGQNTMLALAIHAPMIRTLQNSAALLGRSADVYAVPLTVLVFLAIIPVAMLVNGFVPFLVARKYGPGWAEA